MTKQQTESAATPCGTRQTDPVPADDGVLAHYAGILSGATPGWVLLEATAGELTHVPFEGSYASKGGRIQSPWIDLDKPVGSAAFYSLTFSAQTDAQCYWWVDFEDASGNPLPDVNSAVYAGVAEQAYNPMVYIMGAASRMRLAFQSQAGVTVRDLAVRRVTTEEAAAWCDQTYAGLPRIDDVPATGSFAQLPRTAAALRDGTPWRIVMLGDSIQNDSFNSVFQSLVKRDFPNSALDFVISVRGSTGCWHYADPVHFEDYVSRHQPDLLLIGGISNRLGVDGDEAPREAIRRVIAQAQAVGCEVALLSPPHSVDWRPFDEAHPEATLPSLAWTEETRDAKGARRLVWTPFRDLARECGVAFWNMTVPTANAIAGSGRPHDWFNRDVVHNNDRGKQLIGRVLQRYFQSAAAVTTATSASGSPTP